MPEPPGGPVGNHPPCVRALVRVRAHHIGPPGGAWKKGPWKPSVMRGSTLCGSTRTETRTVGLGGVYGWREKK
jgi:hypothetical protein